MDHSPLRTLPPRPFPPAPVQHRSRAPLYFLIGILFAFVILLVLIVYIVNTRLLSLYRAVQLTGSSLRNANPESGWKEYRSPNFGFSIKYPSDFMAAGNEIDGTLSLFPNGLLLKDLLVTVRIEAHDKYYQTEQFNYPNPVNKGALTIDGKATDKMESVTGQDTGNAVYIIHYLVKDAGFAYSIDCSSSDKNLLDANKNLCLSIASTFRKAPLSPTPLTREDRLVTPTSMSFSSQPETDTFTNKTCGYAFDYPSNWRISSLGKQEVDVEIPAFARKYPGNDYVIRISCSGYEGPKKTLDTEIAQCRESKQQDEAQYGTSVYVCEKVRFDHAEFVQYATKAFNIEEETNDILINIGNDDTYISPEAYRILNSFKLLNPLPTTPPDLPVH